MVKCARLISEWWRFDSSPVYKEKDMAVGLKDLSDEMLLEPRG